MLKERLADESNRSLRSFRAPANPTGPVSDSQHHCVVDQYDGDSILAPSDGRAYSMRHDASRAFDGAHEDRLHPAVRMNGRSRGHGVTEWVTDLSLDVPARSARDELLPPGR